MLKHRWMRHHSAAGFFPIAAHSEQKLSSQFLSSVGKFAQSDSVYVGAPFIHSAAPSSRWTTKAPTSMRPPILGFVGKAHGAIAVLSAPTKRIRYLSRTTSLWRSVKTFILQIQITDKTTAIKATARFVHISAGVSKLQVMGKGVISIAVPKRSVIANRATRLVVCWSDSALVIISAWSLVTIAATF